jgi:hypothetical protein
MPPLLEKHQGLIIVLAKRLIALLTDCGVIRPTGYWALFFREHKQAMNVN